MKTIIINILAVIAGVFIGSWVNGGLIAISGSIIPPPEGINVNDMESLKANIHLFEAKHFIFPFLAHALGTFAGAMITALIAVSHKMKFVLGIGGLFLMGGIYMAFVLPAPIWFIILDLVVAYIPMAYLGGKLIARKTLS